MIESFSLSLRGFTVKLSGVNSYHLFFMYCDYTTRSLNS